MAKVLLWCPVGSNLNFVGFVGRVGCTCDELALALRITIVGSCMKVTSCVCFESNSGQGGGVGWVGNIFLRWRMKNKEGKLCNNISI